MGKQEIEIRSLTSVSDMYEMQKIEASVWAGELITPIHQTITVARNGGIILGAFLGEQMIGMLYSFPGFYNNQAYLCSHAMGIRKEYRYGGIGERLKQVQADIALQRGYKLMTWTYDPLETANGYLNVGKLGVICSTYITDCYGEMEDPMNQGLPTDRFKVEWWLEHERQILPPGDEDRLLLWKIGSTGTPQPVKISGGPKGAEVASLAVPANFQELKQEDMSLAKEWRLFTRQIFTKYFNSGWVVAGFRLRRGEPVHEYLLIRRQSLNLPQPPWQKGV